MILCTVGTHNQPFDRLVTAMDEYAATTDEAVIIQLGCSNYLPQHAEYFPFTTYEHMQELYDQARVVVTHAAAGAIILALELNKPLVIIPRFSKFNEHVDNHQHQLTKALNVSYRAVAVPNPSQHSLSEAINLVKSRQIINKKSKSLIINLHQQIKLFL